MTNNKAKLNEECRSAVMDYLGARPSIAQSADTIWRRLHAENPEFELQDVKDALDFLSGKGLVEKEYDSLGSTAYYKATADGQLFVERKYAL